MIAKTNAKHDKMLDILVFWKLGNQILNMNFKIQLTTIAQNIDYMRSINHKNKKIKINSD